MLSYWHIFFLYFVTDHFISVLQCQTKCTKILATPFHKEEPNYYEEHFNYLQYSYHRGKLLFTPPSTV